MQVNFKIAKYKKSLPPAAFQKYYTYQEVLTGYGLHNFYLCILLRLYLGTMHNILNLNISECPIEVLTFLPECSSRFFFKIMICGKLSHM